MSKEIFIVTVAAIIYAMTFAILNKDASATIAWIGAGFYCWLCYDYTKENEKLIKKLREASDLMDKYVEKENSRKNP